jgi:hypothetical protein
MWGGEMETSSPFGAMRRFKIHVLVYAAILVLMAWLVVSDIWSLLQLWLGR